jgi:hypothetical protein
MGTLRRRAQRETQRACCPRRRRRTAEEQRALLTHGRPRRLRQRPLRGLQRAPRALVHTQHSMHTSRALSHAGSARVRSSRRALLLLRAC